MKLISAVLFSSTVVFAQHYPRYNFFEHQSNFFESDSITVVKGEVPIEYADLFNEYIDIMSDDNYPVIKESELDESCNNLFFIGLTSGFQDLTKYLPPALEIHNDGFLFGGREFSDSLDVIYLFSDDSKYLFLLGNSLKALDSILSMAIGMEQYVIVSEHVPVQYGFLSNGHYDYQENVDILKIRSIYLKRKETDHFIFHYSPLLWQNEKPDSIFRNEDAKIDEAIKILNLEQPSRKVECYIYHDKYKKYDLSYTYGYGNVFDKAWQIHSIGTGAVTHESIHCLFNATCENINSFNSEGIVGYYNIVTDSSYYDKTNKYVKEHFDDIDLEEFIVKDEFWSNPSYGYPISSHFVKFLIENYGLLKFKSYCNENDLRKASTTVYNKTLTELIQEWIDRY